MAVEKFVSSETTEALCIATQLPCQTLKWHSALVAASLVRTCARTCANCLTTHAHISLEHPLNHIKHIHRVAVSRLRFTGWSARCPRLQESLLGEREKDGSKRAGLIT